MNITTTVSAPLANLNSLTFSECKKYPIGHEVAYLALPFSSILLDSLNF